MLSTVPWNNASGAAQKIKWMQDHFGAAEGSPLWKRVILSHHKHLNRGDFLIDDRPERSGAIASPTGMLCSATRVSGPEKGATVKLSSVQLDRAVGAVLGSAAGDALGAPYEFKPPVAAHVEIVMSGGGLWDAGEWTDDTSMAIPPLRVLARGERLEGAALDEVVAAWAGWATTAKDVGIQTRQVLGGLGAPTAAEALSSARRVHDRSGRSGGNGSLMRTGPVALGYLDDLAGLVVAARAVSDLTHVEVDAGDACVIWSVAIRHAVLHGEANVRVGVAALPTERQARWLALVADAEARQPADIANNGWVVAAFQAAWSAIHHGSGYADAVERAVRAGYDTDTVAAIAGSLIGAATGASAIPDSWRRTLHGWPGMTGDELASLAESACHPVPTGT